MSDRNVATRFKPGQSGNPRGSSRKARSRKWLRELFAEGLSEPLPPRVQEKIVQLAGGDPDEVEALVAALSYGDLIKARVLLNAATGSEAVHAKAVDQILSGEPKQYQIDLPEGTSVEVKVEPDRIDEVTAILSEALH